MMDGLGAGFQQLKQQLGLAESPLRESTDGYAFLLRRCSQCGSLSLGRQIHSQFLAASPLLDRSNTLVSNLLVHMYGRFGSVDEALVVFHEIPRKNEFSWNIMMAALLHNKAPSQALDLYDRMIAQGEKIDSFALSTALTACSSLGDLDRGRQIHAKVKLSGQKINTVATTALLDMYAKGGSVEEASSVFFLMEKRDRVAWNAMLAAYAREGHCKETLRLYWKMDCEGVKPDTFTFASVLDACADLGALAVGKSIHQRAAAGAGYDSFDLVLRTSLFNMYSRCGSLDDMNTIFENLARSGDVISWTAVIAAHARTGNSREALELFRSMNLEGVTPNDVTLISVMHACAHAGLLRDARTSFLAMGDDHGVEQNLELWVCMVDSLGRAGRLGDAEELVRAMPVHPDYVAWMTVLASCKLHRDLETGARVAEQVMDMIPENAAPYVVLLSMYALAGKRVEAERVRRTMGERGVKRSSGRSFIEIGNKVHEFVDEEEHSTAPGHDHPKKLQVIKDLIDGLQLHPSETMLSQIDSFSKYHSERMAIGFGLLSSKQGMPVRVVSSVSMCPDCHTAAKNISIITKREIIVRDVSCFHVFRSGECTCRDCW